MKKSEPKILVIRFSSLGDIILMIPLLQVLRGAYPGAMIDLATKESYSEIFKGSTLVDRLHVLREGDFSELIEIRSKLKENRYDIIIDAHNVIRSNILYRSIPAEDKVQISKKQLRKFLLIRFGINLYGEIKSQFERYLSLASELGIPVPDELPHFMLPASAIKRADDLLESLEDQSLPLVTFAPGARYDTKRWNSAGFVSVIDTLHNSGCNIALAGGPAEISLAREISRSAEADVINTAGKLAILETAALLNRSDLLITNDSALLHLSELVHTPVLALFGPTVREFGFYPRLENSRVIESEADCRPCSRNGARECRLSKKVCLDSIEPQLVVNNALSIPGIDMNEGR